MLDKFDERRINFYKNQGVPFDRIVTPLYLASGYVSLILKAPEQASSLKSKFLRVEEYYAKVFFDKIDLNIWHKIAFILKTTDIFLESKRPSSKSLSEHFLKNRRQFVSFLTVSRLTNDFNFSVDDLIKFDIEKFTFVELEISWLAMKRVFPSSMSKFKISRQSFINICKLINKDNSIQGFDRLFYNFGINNQNMIQTVKLPKIKNNLPEISDLFIEKVFSVLPKQPWKPGTHRLVSKELNCSQKEVYAAVDKLIELGKIYKQKDGILFDKDDNIVEIDLERVNPETLELLE